ncbi:MAG: hypothetical protein NWQ17_04365 [Polaribacter sp.]|nr:hypothetical protein [Polaribacter sp.]
MKSKFTLKNTTILVAFLGVFTLNAQIYVDNNTGANAAYSDLQTAIDAASPNDVIYVQPSDNEYLFQSVSGNTIVINKPLTIIGRSHSMPSFSSKIRDLQITDEGSGTVLKGLLISSLNLKGTDGIWDNSSGTGTQPKLVQNVAVINCFISNAFSLTNLKYYNNTPSSIQGTGVNNVIIRGCVFDNIGDNFATNINISNSIIYRGVWFRSSTVVLKNNIFFNDNPVIQPSGSTLITVQNSIFLANTADDYSLRASYVKYENCLTYNYGSGNYNIGSNQGMETVNLLANTNPLFTKNPNSISMSTSSYDISDDYTLQTGSPAIGAGVNGEDLGIFAGYNFSNLGLPAGYPTINIVSSTSSLPQNGTLKVTLTAKAQ